MTVTGNLFLRSFSPDTLDSLAGSMERVEMPEGCMLVEQGSPFESVYFPDSGILSRIVKSEDGEMEVSALGREGFAGVPLTLGLDNSNFKIVSQQRGSGWRIRASEFVELLASNNELRDGCNRYSMFLLNCFSQSVACARLHAADKRCAKWLMTTCDRLNTTSISTTQNLISMRLGVVRPSVNMALNSLQRDGLIKISRQTIEIIDLPGLEARCCECYKKTDELFNQTMGFASHVN